MLAVVFMTTMPFMSIMGMAIMGMGATPFMGMAGTACMVPVGVPMAFTVMGIGTTIVFMPMLSIVLGVIIIIGMFCDIIIVAPAPAGTPLTTPPLLTLPLLVTGAP